jgi:hypothetical protein
MIGRADWRRLLCLVLLAPPVAYIVGLATIFVLLKLGEVTPGSADSIIVFLLFVGVPAIPIAYLLGAIPAVISAVLVGMTARLLPNASWRMLAALPVGALSAWLGNFWLFGQQRLFDSADTTGMLNIAVPIGGAIGALAAIALSEWLAARSTR